MDINQIIYFIEVCGTGNISKAAEKLHISQQGLSASIRRLELELGRDLFYRKASSIVLTETGKSVLTEAKAIAAHVDRINELCSNIQSGKYRMRVAVTESLIVRLPDSLQRLLINGSDEYEVQLVEEYSSNCCSRVNEGDCALGIVYGSPDERLFDLVSLDVVKQVIIVNRSHSLAAFDSIPISALDNVPMVLTHKGTTPHNMLSAMFQQNKLRLNVAYECDRPRQTIDIVSNNPLLAARTVADEVTAQDLEKIKVLELAGESFLMPVKLISKKGRDLNMYERLFKRLIIEAYK